MQHHLGTDLFKVVFMIPRKWSRLSPTPKKRHRELLEAGQRLLEIGQLRRAALFHAHLIVGKRRTVFKWKTVFRRKLQPTMKTGR
jgi:hypothetical protein